MISQRSSLAVICGDMRINGTLRYLIYQSSSFDEDGVPMQGTANWSDPVECFIRTITHNNQGTYQDGQWTQASYEVLIERQHLETVPGRIQLKRATSSDLITRRAKYTNQGVPYIDENGAQVYVIDDSGFEDLGEFEVQDCQSVSLDRYKIIV